MRFNNIVRDIVKFAQKIPGFAGLDLEDQVCLIKGGGFEVCLFTMSSPWPAELLSSTCLSVHPFVCLSVHFCMSPSLIKGLFFEECLPLYFH